MFNAFWRKIYLYKNLGRSFKKFKIFNSKIKNFEYPQET